MKRKVIKQGHNTLTITLPAKWAEKNSIKAGDELECAAEAGSLVISQDKEVSLSKYCLDVNDDIILEREITSLFKKGYDEIRINSDDIKLLGEIQSIIGYAFVGFEMVWQAKDSCVIKNVAEVQDKEFDSVLSRTLFQLKIMAEGIYEAMKNSDLDAIPNLKLMERNNNRYTSFLRRILNKGWYRDRKNDKLVYTFVEFVEKIADEYKYLCGFFMESKKNIEKIPQETLEIFKEINSLVEFTIKCYYKFNQKELYENFKKRKALIKKTVDFIATHSRRDCMVAHYALTIIQDIADTWSLILTINQ